jgi:hypothetical protein
MDLNTLWVLQNDENHEFPWERGPLAGSGERA